MALGYRTQRYQIRPDPDINIYTKISQWCNQSFGEGHWCYILNDDITIQFLFEKRECLSMFLLRWNDSL
jgi:hypothetical protein